MKKSLVFLFLSVFLVATASASDSKFRRSKRPAPGHYIVILADSSTALDFRVRELTARFGGNTTYVFRGAPWEGYSVSGLSEAAALALSRDPRVVVVEEDGIGEVLQAAPKHADWGRDRTNERALALDGVTAAGCAATWGVTIYVMDSGINDPAGTEFGSRLIDLHVAASIADGSSPAHYRDYHADRHGTAVASIAGGATYGVASGATIANVKVVGGRNYASEAIIAIRDHINPSAVNPYTANGPKIVNMSIDYPDTDADITALEQEILHSIQYYYVTYVLGAGNTGIDACTNSPAALGQSGGAITVGATYVTNAYSLDARSQHPNGDGLTTAWWSNYGSCVDIFAPGTRVAALHADTGSIREFSGTSAAAPHVAGAAARRAHLYWSSYNVVQRPWDLEATVKADATVDVIDPATLDPNHWNCLTTTGCATPNLLLYRFHMKCRSVSS